ncbi:MAG: DUF2171 domain-containing protein [Thermomicrobiales bacterium]
MDTSQITEHMPILASDDQQVGVVDHLDGDAIKLTKNDSADGQHHWIPLSWVSRVDEHVHIDRPAADATSGWMNSSPSGN